MENLCEDVEDTEEDEDDESSEESKDQAENEHETTREMPASSLIPETSSSVIMEVRKNSPFYCNKT